MTPWRWEWRRQLLLDELRPGDEWLDLGCGSGAFLELAPGGIGVDPDPESPGGELDGVAHASIDLVWCSEVIEHVADPLALLFEARRVLRPGGRLLLTTPAHPLAPPRGDRRVRASSATSTRAADICASSPAAR